MARFLFFLLFIANAVFAGYWYTQGAPLGLSALSPKAGTEPRDEIDPQKLTVSVSRDAAVEAQKQTEQRNREQTLIAAACIKWSGISGRDADAAKRTLDSFELGTRLVEIRNEIVNRYSVFVPATTDRRAYDQSVQFLKQRKIEWSPLSDGSISLGLFATEESATRYLNEVRAKGARLAQMAARSKELKDVSYRIERPDAELAKKLSVLEREYQGSKIETFAQCPAEPVPTV